ncbi:MAG: T9SS type A sorting domain-containing protein [Algibacter sp.]
MTNFPLVTLASMLGPSPDWFIGVESLSMVDVNGLFIPKITYELYPYDAGILSDNSVLIGDCCGREPLSVPQENIHLITTESGETIGPGSLGQIVFTAISPTLTIETNEAFNSVIEIYPNPVSNHLNIQTELLNFQFLIFDLKGSLLYKESNKSIIDITPFTNGMYLLEIINKKTKK